MGFYNVVAPCVVGKLHYARPTTTPIEVDDDVAEPLVESGCLEKYQPWPNADLRAWLGTALVSTGQSVAELAESAGMPIAEAEPEAEKPKPRPRGRGRASEG